MSDKPDVYPLGVTFGRAQMRYGRYAHNENEMYRRHFTPEEQNKIYAVLLPYIRLGEVTGFKYEFGPSRNLLTVQRKLPGEPYRPSDCPGILWLAKIGEKGQAPRYEVNYGIGKPGESTLNFETALQLSKLHLEAKISGQLPKPSAQVLALT